MLGGVHHAPLVLALATAVACGGRDEPGARTDTEGVEDMSRSIEEVQEAFTPEWMELEGVVGTAIGLCDGEPCIKVYVLRRTDELAERIPAEVEGHKVVLEASGRFRPRDTARE